MGSGPAAWLALFGIRERGGAAARLRGGLAEGVPSALLRWLNYLTLEKPLASIHR